MKRLLSLIIAMFVIVASLQAPLMVQAEPAEQQEETIETPEGEMEQEETSEEITLESEESEPALGDLLEEEGEEVTLTATIDVDMDEFMGYDDSEEMFAAYVDSIFYQDFNYGITPFSTGAYTAGNRLSGLDKEMYDALVPMIKNPGNNGYSTQFQLSSDTTQFSSIVGKTFTYSALGYSGQAQAAADENLLSRIMSEAGYGDSLMRALLSDMPYELFWFDKTKGVQMRAGGSVSYGASSLTVTRFSVMYYMAVAQEYAVQGSGTYNPSQLNQTKYASVNTSYTEAQRVKTENASKTDDEKLRAYLDYIKGATDYNHTAANNSGYPYGDPWQLIYVFDKNPSTMVVCEGYAKAFQYLCDITSWTGNVQCYTVTGGMSGGTGPFGDHMWNIVSIAGKNYIVDVTNCDTGSVGAPDKIFLKSASSADEISGTWDGEYTVTSTSSNVRYYYDAPTISMFGQEVLELASAQYNPNAANNIAGTLTISGTAKYGQTLTASATGTGGGALTYKWLRGTTEVGTGTSYTIQTADIGAVITCVVTEDGKDGDLRKSTATVQKADATGSVSGVTVGIGRLIGTNATMQYSTNTSFTNPTTCGAGSTEGLVAGQTYYVRVAPTATNNASAYVPFTIPRPATAPTGKTLTFNGSVQTGVDAGTGYTLSGHQQTNAGSYSATATLQSGYMWTDNETTAAKTISWRINPVTLSGVPQTASYNYTASGAKTFSLANLLPAALKNTGVTYTFTSRTDANNVLTADPTVSGTNLSYTVASRKTSADAGQSAVVTINVSPSGNTNFTPFDVTLTVKLTSNPVPTISTMPTITGTFGTAANRLTVNAGRATYSGQNVAGTWALAADAQSNTSILPVGTSTTLNVTFTPNSGSYEKVTVPVTPSISKKVITLAISGTATKPYDGNTSVTSSLSLSVSGTVSGYTSVSARAGSYSYNNATVGTKTVTANSITLTGGDAGNYSLPAGAVTATGTITRVNVPDISISGYHSNNGSTYTYTVNPINGAQYRMDSGRYTTYNVFSGITPGSTHTFSAYIPAGTNTNASNTATITVTFPKLSTAAPNIQYTVAKSDTGRTVTVTSPVGSRVRYSFDGGSNWVTTPTHTYAVTDPTATIKVKYEADATHEASEPATETIDFSKAVINVIGGLATVHNISVKQAVAGDVVTVIANTQAGNGEFIGWSISPATITLADATSETTTFTMPDPAVDVTVTANFKRAGGGGGGGGGAAPAPEDSPADATISGSTSSDVEVSVSGDTASVDIPAETVRDIASNDRGNATSSRITIDLSKLPAKVVAVTLPLSTVTAIADTVNSPANNKTTVEIALPNATVTLDAVAITAISVQANAKDVQLVVKPVESTSSALNTAQKAAVANANPVMITDVYFASGNTRISNINNGTMQIQHTNFKATAGRSLKYYHVLYVDDNGKTTPRNTWITPNGLAFETYHNSIYMIVYDESHENSTGTPVYRIFNPVNGDHVMTASLLEKNAAVAAGWRDEGIYFNASTEADATPIYRLFNPVTGEHFYTASAAERDIISKAGWNNEGEVFKVKGNTALYRVFNSTPGGFHHFTANPAERDALLKMGWNDEGISWTV